MWYNMAMQGNNSTDKTEDTGGRQIIKYTYGKHVRISTCAFFSGSIIMCVWVLISLIMDSSRYSIGANIFMICFFTVMLALTAYLIFNTIKYRVLTGRVILNAQGVRYRSSAATFFLPWEKIQKIELQLFQHNYRNMPKPYIVFFSDYRIQKDLRFDVINMSDDFMFVHFTSEVRRFIEHDIGRTVVRHDIGAEYTLDNSGKKLARDKEKYHREKRRAWKKILRHGDRH